MTLKVRKSKFVQVANYKLIPSVYEDNLTES